MTKKQFSPDGTPIIETRDLGELGTRFICERGEAWREEEIILDDACSKCGRRLIDCQTGSDTRPCAG